VSRRTSATLDARFRALADPTRRAMVQRLARGEATVSELAEPHAMGLPAISKHITVLEEAGMVRRWRAGRVHRCRLEPRALQDTEDWLSQTRRDWERLLDRLEAMLIEDKETEKNGHRTRR
jgi:DNA-binding transcriptional ArsR family regulator